MLHAPILLGNCHQLLDHLPTSNSCIKGSWQGWNEEGDGKFLKCLTTSTANYSSCIHPPVRCNEAFYTSLCVNILMIAPFSICDACPGKSGQWWWVQRGCRPSVPAAWICAQSALEHDSMQAICPGALLRGRANVYLRSPYMTSLAQSISDMSNDRHWSSWLLAWTFITIELVFCAPIYYFIQIIYSYDLWNDLPGSLSFVELLSFNVKICYWHNGEPSVEVLRCLGQCWDFITTNLENNAWNCPNCISSIHFL